MWFEDNTCVITMATDMWAVCVLTWFDLHGASVTAGLSFTVGHSQTEAILSCHQVSQEQHRLMVGVIQNLLQETKKNVSIQKKIHPIFSREDMDASSHPCSRTAVVSGPQVGHSTFVVSGVGSIQRSCFDGQKDDWTGKNPGHWRLVQFWREQQKPHQLIWSHFTDRGWRGQVGGKQMMYRIWFDCQWIWKVMWKCEDRSRIWGGKWSNQNRISIILYINIIIHHSIKLTFDSFLWSKMTVWGHNWATNTAVIRKKSSKKYLVSSWSCWNSGSCSVPHLLWRWQWPCHCSPASSRPSLSVWTRTGQPPDQSPWQLQCLRSRSSHQQDH